MVDGLLLAAAAAAFQYWSSVQQANTTYQRQLLESRYRLLETFWADFETDMTLFLNIRMLQLFLLTEEAKTPVGLSREEALKLYSAQARHFQENRHPQAVLSQVDALFIYAKADDQGS